MPSKTSCFNKAIFRKNLTRFSPVWVLYTICLILGLFLVYTDGGAARSFGREFYFVNNMAELIGVMGIINLGYALLVAQLLFGDLFNARMCNMLHAMPLRRESWFVTGALSGLTFSLMPTAVMTLVAIPLLNGTFYVDAWQIALLWFAGTNLEYVCFFGLAVFAAMCVGNRFTMAAGYGLLNAGAYILYWLIDTVYTPMLYGIVTPTTLATNLTPVYHMVDVSFIEVDGRAKLREQFGDKFEGAIGYFTVTGEWWRLFLWAAVGLAFLAAALLLYRKRDLECAGDAVAFRPLVPVFQVICAIFVMTAAQFFLYVFLGLDERNYWVLTIGLIVGWFIGRMLIERSTRVFRLQNWYGLGALAAALLVTLACTRLDILNIEERMPRLDRIKAVSMDTGYASTMILEEEKDIQDILLLHELALEDRAEEGAGTYVLGTNGEWVRNIDANADAIDEEAEDPQYRYVVNIGLRYELENGNTVRREYNVWVDSPAGEIVKEHLNRWENVYGRENVTVNGVEIDYLELTLNTFENFTLGYMDGQVPEAVNTRENAESFLAAVRADGAAGNMAQHPGFHDGYFRIENDRYEEGYTNRTYLWVSLNGETYGWSVGVYADSENTLRWLEEHELLPEGIRYMEGSLGYY